jgi:hypothetical protein
MNELRKEARSGLTQKYNWDYVTEQYLEVFQELSGKRVSSPLPVNNQESLEEVTVSQRSDF